MAQCGVGGVGAGVGVGGGSARACVHVARVCTCVRLCEEGAHPLSCLYLRLILRSRLACVGSAHFATYIYYNIYIYSQGAGCEHEHEAGARCFRHHAPRTRARFSFVHKTGPIPITSVESVATMGRHRFDRCYRYRPMVATKSSDPQIGAIRAIVETFQSSLLDRKAANDLLITNLRAEAVVLTA